MPARTSGPRKPAKNFVQRMEDELDLNRKIFGVSPVGIAIFKASGEGVSANEAAARIVGGNEDDLRRQNFRTIPSWQESGLSAAADEALKTGHEVRKEIHFTSSFGREVWLDCRMVSFQSRGTLHLLLVMVDLLELRTAQAQGEAARLEAEKMKAASEIIENMMDPIMIHDPEGRIREVNRAFRTVMGYGNEILGQFPDRLVVERDGPKTKDAMLACSRDGKIKNLRVTGLTKDGREIPFMISVGCLYDERGRFRGQIAVARDISDILIAEESLRGSEERYRRIVETAEEGVWVINAENRTVFVNGKMARILGYDADEMIGKSLFDFMDAGDSQIAQSLINRRKLGIREQRDFKFRRKDGTAVWTSLSGNPIYDPDGTYAGSLAMISDISDRKRAEDALATALKEKEVLLREVYHRSKNNMQIISSLLNLQAGRIEDPAFRDILKQNQSRIRTMALVHEKLYKSGDLTRINFAEYIRSLTTQLLASAGPVSERIALGLDVAEVSLNVSTAIPCGLILNELLINAIKHAFPDGRAGELKVFLRAQGPGRYVIKVADNGVGFPKDLDFRRAQTMGLEIINALVGQIEGTIDLDRSRGTAFTVEFGEQAS